jgi:hypothetical protein
MDTDINNITMSPKTNTMAENRIPGIKRDPISLKIK